MTSERARRLAAVWFADIVGFSTLSSRDEDAALELVQALQEASRAAVDAHGGRVVKWMGDATLAVFDSVDGALQAALALTERFHASAAAGRHGARLRVGLHLGEITEADDGDIYGDGVNVASRLQSNAPPGQVLVSRAVQETLRGRPDVAVRWTPVWRWLKGLGLARAFLVTAAGAPAPSVKALPSRAIAVGLTTALVAFALLTLNVAMKGGSLDVPEQADPAAGDPLLSAAGLPLLPADVENGTVRLHLGVEEYAAGDYQGAVEALAPFAREPLRHHPDAPRGLRFLARAHLQADHVDMARATLAQMVNAEPPLALLIPGADVAALLRLYYDVRRDAALDERVHRPASPPLGVVVFDFESAGDAPAELGPNVAQMVASDMESSGVTAHYFWRGPLGVVGERAYTSFTEAVRPGGTMPASHVLLGRASIVGGETVVSARVYDLATGAMAASVLVSGDVERLLTVVERLGVSLASDLGGVAPGGSP
jgi:class 3 adenylate cyclase